MTDQPPGRVPGPMGSVSVRLSESSMFLQSALPVEVRDSSLRLVARATGAGSVQLPVGLYEVSAVLGDGQRHSSYVNVQEGMPTPVEFGQPAAAASSATGAEAASTPQVPKDVPKSPGLEPMGKPTARLPSDVPTPSARPAAFEGSGSLQAGVTAIPRPTYTEGIAAARDDAAATTDVPELELLELAGATIVDRQRTRLTVQCESSITGVATATVRVAGHRQRLSLPISPQTWTPSGGGVVTVERTSSGFHAQAWISPERRVANGLQNMLSAGFVLEAAKLANEAVDLLRSKYEDPTGAALGALVLHKAGLLERWESWMENLARDFAWLPDGAILLVATRVGLGRPDRGDLATLLRAAGQRVLYAETASLLLDLLRRWPEDDGGAEAAAALERLAGDAPYVDRDAICLGEWIPEPGA
jgi:hypothetical protein